MKVEAIKEEFSGLHEKLLIDEQELEVLMTQYATGGDVRMSDIDEAFKNMKDHLKEVRKLAQEYNKQKDS